MEIDLEELFSMIQVNIELQELNKSYFGHNILYHIENLVRKWHNSLTSFCLTLLDRMGDFQRQVVTQLAIRKHTYAILSQDDTYVLQVEDVFFFIHPRTPRMELYSSSS